MIPRECKRLAEVDFPVAEVSRHSAREKSIRHGHPSTLHLWWARRPLAACRAMLLALLLPDPEDEHCPGDFKEAARVLLPKAGCGVGSDNAGIRRALLKFIGDFANWDLATNQTYLEVSRGLVRAAHGDEPPLVVDPFAGGGSIPLEALRLDCDAFASDLNPVACLILKVLLEDIPRRGPALPDELRRVGAQVKEAAEKEIVDLYPADPDGAKPIAYLWARTVRCESPECGAEIPLVRSFWLCKKARRKRALRHRVVRSPGESPRAELEVFQPQSEGEVPSGTVARARATCVACGAVLPPERVRTQLADQHGGADAVFDVKGRRTGGARLLAVVTLRTGEPGRHYRLPTASDYSAVRRAQSYISKLLGDWEDAGRPGLCPVPDEPLPPIGTLGFRVQRYGMLRWGDLFTARQKVVLLELGRAIQRSGELARPLSLALGKLADLANDVCPWEPIAECPRNVLSNGRLKPAWDFAEGVALSDSSGGFGTCLANLASGVESVRGLARTTLAEVAAAQESPLPDDAGAVWFTDPPYYDAIPYSDLSDFFYVWYRRVLPEHVPPDPFDSTNNLTPKALEAVHDESKEVDGRRKDRAFFEDLMARAFTEGKRVVCESGIASVVFAHKTTEGWEALLAGIIRGGWTITGSWPIATEQAHRLRARDSAALATSVHLVCRPRSEDAGVGDWADVLRALPGRVDAWMERLQEEGIRGADLVFACIGPALEIYSQFSMVETTEGRRVALAEYLEKVWEAVGRTALARVLGGSEGQSAAAALEEDARLTALFLWALESTNGQGANTPNGGGGDGAGDDADDEEEAPRRKAKGFSLIHDVVRRFAQPLGIHLNEWEGRVIETKKGVVRLLPIAERARLLFGREGAAAVASRLESGQDAAGQLALFPEAEEITPRRGTRGTRTGRAVETDPRARRDATTLDRVHAAMLLQRAGRTHALRALLAAERDRGPEFLRLANALAALYPRGTEERRLVEAMLLAVPR